MNISDAQPQTAMGITRTTNEVEQDEISDHAKCIKKIMKGDREYQIDHIVQFVGKGATGDM